MGFAQMNSPIGGIRPDEAPAFEPLGKQAQTIAIPPEQFDEVAAPATKHEDVTAEWVCRQLLLGNGSQSIKATAHISHAGRQPDLRSYRQSDHSLDARQRWPRAVGQKFGFLK